MPCRNASAGASHDSPNRLTIRIAVAWAADSKTVGDLFRDDAILGSGILGICCLSFPPEFDGDI